MLSLFQNQRAVTLLKSQSHTSNNQRFIKKIQNTEKKINPHLPCFTIIHKSFPLVHKKYVQHATRETDFSNLGLKTVVHSMLFQTCQKRSMPYFQWIHVCNNIQGRLGTSESNIHSLFVCHKSTKTESYTIFLSVRTAMDTTLINIIKI